MPKGFVRIRRFGIYNSTVKRNLALQFKPEGKELEKQGLKDKKEWIFRSKLTPFQSRKNKRIFS
jgi:hypothetical protein